MSRPAVQLFFARTGQEAVDRNFGEVSRVFGEACPVTTGVVTDQLELAIGTNTIKLPGRIKMPVGRLTVFQTVASDILDVGPDGNGNWQVTSSAATAVRFLFF